MGPLDRVRRSIRTRIRRRLGMRSLRAARLGSRSLPTSCHLASSFLRTKAKFKRRCLSLVRSHFSCVHYYDVDCAIEWLISYYAQAKALYGPHAKNPALRGLMKEGICRAGEVFYVPSGYWHRTRSHLCSVGSAHRGLNSCRQSRTIDRCDAKLCISARAQIGTTVHARSSVRSLYCVSQS